MSDVSDSEYREEFVFEENPIDAFLACAEANDWECEREMSHRCSLVAEKGSLSLSVTVHWDEVQEVVFVAIAFELECPPRQYPALCVHLSEVSQRMVLGSFFYQREYELLIWKYGLTLAGVPGIMPDQVVMVLEYGMAEFNKQLPHIQKIVGIEDVKDVPTPQSSHAPPYGRMN